MRKNYIPLIVYLLTHSRRDLEISFSNVAISFHLICREDKFFRPRKMYKNFLEIFLITNSASASANATARRKCSRIPFVLISFFSGKIRLFMLLFSRAFFEYAPFHRKKKKNVI